MTSVSLPFVDHVVLLVHDLEQAAADMEAAGFTVLQRADTAEKPGSTFRFVSFADGSYVLLNAFSDENLEKHRLGPLLKARQGWADWSFVVDDLDAAIARAEAAAIPLGPLNAVKNTLATGEAWGLRLLVSGRGSPGDVALPFLVEDVEGRHARIPGPSSHANGASGIAEVTIASDNPVGSARRLAILLDLPLPEDPALVAGNTTLRFVPKDLAGRGTAQLGGPVAVAFHGLERKITIGDWEVARLAPVTHIQPTQGE